MVFMPRELSKLESMLVPNLRWSTHIVLGLGYFGGKSQLKCLSILSLRAIFGRMLGFIIIITIV